MPIHASPGVYSETLDFSLYAPKLTNTTLALIGKTIKGPTEPTFISSARQFTDTFGTPRKTDYSALAAISFLEYGSACWFRRIVGSKAKSAYIGIPTAVSKNEIIEDSVPENNRQYIYTATLTDAPIPGTVNITLSDPNKNINTINIKDSGVINLDTENKRYGLFDANTNPSISNYANYIDYDTSNFRFSLNTLTPTKNVIVKYIRKTTDVALATLTPTVSGATATGTIPSYTSVVYKSALKASSFVLVIVNAGNTYRITAKTDAVSPLGSVCQLSCKNQSGATIALTTGTLDLITGEWNVVFTDALDLTASGTTFAVSYSYDIFKWKNLGVYNAFTDTLGIPCSSNSIFIYTVETTVTDEADIKAALSNEYSAIAKDDGNGNIIDVVDDSLLKGTNTVNYDTKAVNFALTSIPSTGLVITINYMSKNTYTMGTTDSSGNYSGTLNINSIVLPGSVTITVNDNVYTDNGSGSIVKNGVTYGDIIYKNSEGYATVDFTYVGTVSDANESVVLTCTTEMGKIEAKSLGNSFNGTTVEFYALDYKNSTDTTKYYGVKIWTSDQLTTSTPAEHFHGFTFGDSEATTYFTNKVVSNIVDFELNDESGNIIPVLNTKLVLANGFDDSSNINSNSAVTAISDFANSETYDINLIAVPDFPGDKVVIEELIDLCENQRGDCFAIIDPPQALTVQNVVDWHNGDGNYANENALNSQMAALYYPWIKINNNFTESLQWVPPSVKIVSVYAYSDSNAEVWFAPAGFNRGRVFTAVALERTLNIADRDLLYATGTNAINPISDNTGDGIVVYGQKTLQRATTAQNRVNVVRLITYMSKVLATAVKYLLFEPNDELTWIEYKQLVEPLMTDIKTRRGLYYFNIKCDSTTNTASDIDNSIMIAEISLQPTKAAEIIINRFKIMSTGATLEE